MKFIVWIRMSDSHEIAYEFNSPLERAEFLRANSHREQFEIRLAEEEEADDYPPRDEAHWYPTTPFINRRDEIE